ncbi:hypothetical protein GH865_06570 [Rhodocyclus tenuis]|uniref:hypothetical protein n=1 Tax=Rhodocyclus gracilis TaxID=2929842 RepID=UPI001298983E|nr:hypothetical protein [Rhodocyclus gracilis]MRD72914.1 hypothetical protein [Rhodocyclus gracilis]
MRFSRELARASLIAALATVSLNSQAAPDEIQVYTEEMDEPGDFGLELHVNYVPKGRREATYDGEMASNHRLQVTPEFSYGISKTLEAGLYLPVAMSTDGNLYGNGVRLRLKYIAPRADGDHFFWGLNGEFGSSARRVSESALTLEFRPIMGYRDENWLVSFNPILDADLSTNVSRKPNFEPGLKVTHRVGEGKHAGFEYYGEYGPVGHLLQGDERTHYLYGVMDIDLHGFDINFGIGRGFRSAEDQWVAKAIIAFPLN